MNALKEHSFQMNTPHAGGTVLNESVGGHLRDLFKTATWQEHLRALSESIGFSLVVYSETREQIFASSVPLRHRFLSLSGEPHAQCEAQCAPHIMSALATGKPEVFKCYCKIMSFVIPIEYRGEKAVILGQGTFSSYEDFRECMNLALDEGLEEIPIPMPVTFTSQQRTSKICRFVSDSLKNLLTSSQETLALKKKIENLKNTLLVWPAAAEDRPEALYRTMISKLFELFEIDNVSILVYESIQGRYMTRYSLSKTSTITETMRIGQNDVIVLELLAGKPFVTELKTEEGGVKKAFSVFPIMVNKRLVALLRLEDKGLSAEDKQMIASFCRQSSLAIENYRLHQELYRKYGDFAVLSEMTKSLTNIQNYETLIQKILDMSTELVKAEQGSLMLLDRETNALFLEARKGNGVEAKEKLRIPTGEGIAGKVAERGEAFLVKNLERDPRIRRKNRGHYKTMSFVSVPLKVEDRVIGVLSLSDKITGEVFDEEDLKLIQSFATHAAVIMERNTFYNKTEELKKLTVTDSLTGLHNRRYLSERLSEELSRSERTGHHLSLVMMDLDGFKVCNDTLGHRFGDSVLQNVAEILVKTVRSMDIVTRYGGDEFVIMLPETGQQVAMDIAERLRINIEKKIAILEDKAATESYTLTASIGVACYPQHGETGEILLEHVDKALYRAKKKGKNRIEVYS
jgi:diguanylate cyclase (GGDEF)-like protein